MSKGEQYGEKQLSAPAGHTQECMTTSRQLSATQQGKRRLSAHAQVPRMGLQNSRA